MARKKDDGSNKLAQEIIDGVYSAAGEILAPIFKREIPFGIKQAIAKIWDDPDERPQVTAQNKTKETGAWHFVMALPKGKVCLEDFVKEERYLRDAAGGENMRIEIKPHGKAVLLSVYPSTLKDGKEYVFPWNNFKELVEEYAKTDGKPFDIPVMLGFQLGDTPFFVDLATLPHLLLGGATGTGKSTGLHCLLNCLIRLDPMPIIVVIDLKKTEYTYLMHHVNLFTTQQAGAMALEALENEMYRRQELFEEIPGCVKIQTYNRKTKTEKLPFIVCVIDEIAEFEEDADTQKRLARLARLARNVGISLVACTQKPEADIFPYVKFTRMRNNFVGRLCFPVTDEANSNIILGVPIGASLPDVPGRAFFKKNRRIVEVQFPFIDPEIHGIANLPVYLEVTPSELEPEIRVRPRPGRDRPFNRP